MSIFCKVRWLSNYACIVKNNLAKFAGYNGDILDVYPSPLVTNYRNHITFAVSPNGRLGFFLHGTREVFEVKQCFLADEVINKCIDDVFLENELFFSPFIPIIKFFGHCLTIENKFTCLTSKRF